MLSWDPERVRFACLDSFSATTELCCGEADADFGRRHSASFNGRKLPVLSVLKSFFLRTWLSEFSGGEEDRLCPTACSYFDGLLPSKPSAWRRNMLCGLDGIDCDAEATEVSEVERSFESRRSSAARGIRDENAARSLLDSDEGEAIEEMRELLRLGELSLSFDEERLIDFFGLADSAGFCSAAAVR